MFYKNSGILKVNVSPHGTNNHEIVMQLYLLYLLNGIKLKIRSLNLFFYSMKALPHILVMIWDHLPLSILSAWHSWYFGTRIPWMFWEVFEFGLKPELHFEWPRQNAPSAEPQTKTEKNICILQYLFWFTLSSFLIRKIHLEQVSDILCALCVFRPFRFKVMEKMNIIARLSMSRVETWKRSLFIKKPPI